MPTKAPVSKKSAPFDHLWWHASIVCWGRLSCLKMPGNAFLFAAVCSYLQLMLCIVLRLPEDPVRRAVQSFPSFSHPFYRSLSLDIWRPMADDAERGARDQKTTKKSSMYSRTVGRIAHQVSSLVVKIKDWV